MRIKGLTMKQFLYNFKGHFLTIITHKKEVFKNCLRAGIIWQGIVHDLSKFSPEEFYNGVIYYQGDRSPNEGEREEYGYSKAWMHHKGRNKHHFEYWTDYDKITKKLTPVRMPKRYVIEMFCDRVAASKVYKKELYTDRSPLEYFKMGTAAGRMHPQTAKEIERLLTRLAVKGEKETFKYIRKALIFRKPL